ncbi:MAG: hypothetical protein CM1200mP13_01280 [Candidatus Pelagibacterales bacterium]|nr:MAG: hypothetical protein CM1200mP13_01280 [Pelagibacterales bacterium]
MNKIKNKYPKVIKKVRGQGFLLGLALKKIKQTLLKKLLQKRLLTVKASENVVRLLPPLNVTKKEINLALKILNNVCENY